MKIFFISCGFDGGKSGISIYMSRILPRLAQFHDVTVLATEADRPLLPELSNVKYEVLPSLFNRPLFNMLYVWFLPLFYKKNRFDVLFLPAANRRACGWKKWFTIAVVHDLSQFHIPAKYDVFRMFYVMRCLPWAVRKADRVVAISKSTESDLKQFWRIPESKITVNYNGYDSNRYQPEFPEKEAEAVLQKYRLDKWFLLYVSRIEHPGKNHLRLIQAYEALPGKIREQYDLVLGGSLWTGADVVMTYAANSSCSERIHFIDYVPAEELPALYHKASLYVCPSLFEGFGLSIPEAMACGCICTCSNNSSLKEVAGEAAIQFDPESVEDMASAIARTLVDESLRKDLRERGFQRASEFSWDTHTQTLSRLAEEKYRRKNSLFGISYDNVTMSEALNHLEQAVLSGKRAKTAFVNADCFNKAWTDAEYKKVLSTFDFIFPDGSGVALAGKMIGQPVRDNVNGTDMLPHLLDRCLKKGISLYLLGAAPGVAEKMKHRLEQKWVGLKIAGCHDGFHLDNIVETINKSKADILLVAMGVPIQEKWIHLNYDRLNCKLVIGVGGLFDFYSGNIRRAPKWLRKIGMEWSFRFAMEPRRMFRRYVFGNPLFVLRVFRKGTDYEAK